MWRGAKHGIRDANADAFDAFGWLYFVRDNYDLYYPGYYDSWPSLNGAMGATYETDGGPALLKRREDGIVDAIFTLSQPVTGAYYWCPPMRGGRLDLRRLGL